MDIRLDSDHDIWYENGLIDSVSDSSVDGVTDTSELQQSLKIAFLTGLGEYAFDTDAGVGYREIVFVKPFDEVRVRAEMTRVALGREGVTEVKEIVIDTDFEIRHSTITLTLDTIYGITEVELQ
jgi:hypothetical protein